MYISFECLGSDNTEVFIYITVLSQPSLPNPWMPPHLFTWPVICNSEHPAMRWYSVWDLTSIVMYTCMHTFAPYRTILTYSLLPCWWIDEDVWVISMGITRGELMGDILFQSLHFCYVFHHLLSCCSSVQFVISFVHFVSPHPFWSFVCVCVSVSFFFFGGGGAECLWSINPLNAIKHTMHRRWPFKTNVHSLQSRSCSRAIGSSPSCTSALSMSIVDKVIVSFDLLDVRSSNFYREEKIIHCLMLKSNQPIQRSGPCLMSVFSPTVALGLKPAQIYQVWPMRAYVSCPCVKYCAFPIIMMYN